MDMETVGKVVAVNQQGWLKFNTKPMRAHSLDGSIFPHIVKVKYAVEGREFICKQWVEAGCRVPDEGETVKVLYSSEKPAKSHAML